MKKKTSYKLWVWNPVLFVCLIKALQLQLKFLIIWFFLMGLISKLELDGKYDLTKKAIITFVVKNEIPWMEDSPTILHNWKLY